MKFYSTLCLALLASIMLNACSSSAAAPQPSSNALVHASTPVLHSSPSSLPERIEHVVNLDPVFVHPSAEDLKEAGLH